MRLEALVAALICLAVPASARALCNCVCVEGTPRTVCTTPDEAAMNPSLCGSRPPDCPAVAPPAHVERYEPPDGATDCESARLFDPATDAYTIRAKLCRTATMED
jgi:hypothetical protein